jgi:hypothetical protein
VWKGGRKVRYSKKWNINFCIPQVLIDVSCLEHKESIMFLGTSAFCGGRGTTKANSLGDLHRAIKRKKVQTRIKIKKLLHSIQLSERFKMSIISCRIGDLAHG